MTTHRIFIRCRYQAQRTARAPAQHREVEDAARPWHVELQTYACMYTYMCIYIYYVCVYIYAYIYIYVYIQYVYMYMGQPTQYHTLL